jgi:hypothetical protein
MANRIDALAGRVEDDPFFLGSALARFARSEQLDRHGLAQALGCDEGRLSRLALCRRPRGETFWEDACRIAARFDLHPDTIAEVVRRAEVLEAWNEAEADRGWLQAARDRTDGDGGTQ